MRKIAILASFLLFASPLMVSAVVVAPELDSAEAANTGGSAGKDAGDTVVLEFSENTNKPTIDETNIDDVLDLNNSHSWLDGDGDIGSATWNSEGDELTITISDGTSLPTVALGDEVTIMGSVIQDETEAEDATGSEIITGSFSDEEAEAPELDDAQAVNKTGGTDAKEAGDKVVLTFDEATNKPDIDKDNIDDVLDLDNGHSWLDGDNEIGSATWNSAGTMLTIVLSAGTSLPTVAIGDEVSVSGSTIQDADETVDAEGSETIDGSFGTAVNDDEDDEDEDDGDEEEVGHACANTLINGRLYKEAGEDNPTVYLAAGCILKPFRGAAVFHARGGKFRNIIVLSSLSGFEVSNKPALPAPGTLIKGSHDAVWFVGKNGRRRGFISANVFASLGFQFNQINQISDDDLNVIEEDDEDITNPNQHPDGSLIKCGNSATVFEVHGNSEFPFANLDSFELRGHSFAHIANVDCGRFHYVVGVAITQ